MKRLFALCICLIMPLYAFSCSVKKGKTETGEKEEDTKDSVAASETKEGGAEATEEKTEVTCEISYDKVSEPLTASRLAAIPIANSSMTTDQLRQICIDYVKLSVSFQWVPNESFRYEARQKGGTPVQFTEGKLHGGIPYVNVASGNLYRILEYYDEETGILDVKFLSKNMLLFGTACSGTTDWGWHRVINSARLSWTSRMNQANGLIPVGNYTYPADIEVFGVEGGLDCTDIASENGEQTMYESYAMTLPADCLVSNGHVRMTAEKPVVVRNEDGTINGKESYIVQVEQGLFTTGANHKRVSADGVEYVNQGNDGQNGDGSPYYYTFEQLFKKGYLPHTFKEFLGTDPVEEAEVSFEYEGDVFTADANALKEKCIRANYVLSHTVTTLYDAEGNVALRYVKMIHPHYNRYVLLEDVLPLSALAALQKKGEHSIRVEVQLGTGEKVVAYEGILPKA